MSYGDSIRTTAANLQKLFGEITCQDRAKTFCVFRSETKNKEKFSIYGLDKGKKIGSFDIEADSKEISAQVKKEIIEALQERGLWIKEKPEVILEDMEPEVLVEEVMKLPNGITFLYNAILQGVKSGKLDVSKLIP